MTLLFARHALLPHGWAEDVLLDWDASGSITEVRAGAPPPAQVEHAAGALIPGMTNLHSHAFQRAFAGLAEYRSSGADDSFWTWRELMYRFALALTPDELEQIATWLYIEMLQGGYTSVCEFHYLHHDPSGRPYANPAELSLRLLQAARRAGIGITLLPVLYQSSRFGGVAPRAEQRRFVNSVDELLDIVRRASAEGACVGVAPHSLRAVAPAALRELLAGAPAAAPIHIHIAEQQGEVQDCLDWSGQRPVQWLLDHAPVDRRWCLVHATHIDAAERQAIVASGATVGLCPSTEANLGDGVFDAAAYLGAGGAWGIGSDSHATVLAAEELRGLEYSQRLAQRRRNVLADAMHPQLAERLWLAAVAGGAQAGGRALGGLAVGEQADLVVLDGARLMAGLTPSQALATHVFASHGRNAVRDVWVGGERRIGQDRHALEEAASRQFVAARSRLLGAI